MNKLLYMGDATERKGAREFMQVARALGVTPTVIAHEYDAIFEGSNFYSFKLEQRKEMFDLIRQQTVAFISSKNECPGYVVLECLQYIPVVVNGDYEWTRILEYLDVGATIVPGHKIVETLRQMLTEPVAYDNSKLVAYSQRSIQAWIDLTNGLDTKF